MMIEEAITAHLKSEVPLVAGRVDPFQPRATAVWPLLVYKRIYTEEDYDHGGFSGSVYCRFQITCWADTYLAVKQIAAEVRAALRGFSGIMGGSGGVSVGSAMVDDEMDAYQPDLKKHVTIIDVRLRYAES